jgi:hypothetical protein
VGEGTRILDPMAAKSLPEAVVAMCKVHWLREILTMTSWVLDYSENPITQQILSHV